MTPALRADGLRSGLLLRAVPDGVPGVRDVLRSGLARAFGPPAFDPGADPGDPGLHGPGAASWQVIGQPAAIVGGIRALLTQLLHPLAMAGVADHSAFRDDALGRLQRTSQYVTTSTLGSTREAFAVARTVRRVHRRVTGTAPDGRPYRAADPDLLAWVQVALTTGFLGADAAYSPAPVRGRRADAFVAEQSRAAALLDERVDLDALEADPAAVAALRAGTLPLPLLVEGRLPQTVAELRTRFAAYRPELGLGPQGREAVRFLSWPRVPPAVRAGYLPLLAGALATMEPDLRRMLGVRGGRLPALATRTSARTLLLTLRTVMGPSPAVAAATARAAASRATGGAAASR